MLKIKGTITTNELADELGVSKMTIGRNLKELGELGVIKPFHGGSMYKSDTLLERHIFVKQDLFIEEKHHIAKLVAKKMGARFF